MTDLNKLIAEKLFGSCYHETVEITDEAHICKCGGSVLNRKFWGWDNPDYCGNIEDAFKVMEKLVPKNSKGGWICNFNGVEFSVEIRTWRHSDSPLDKRYFRASADTLPLAICLAAKAALEKSDD